MEKVDRNENSKERTISTLKTLGYNMDKIGDSLMIVKNREWSFGLGEIKEDGSVKIYSYELYRLDLIFDRFSLREDLEKEGIIYTESGVDAARETLKKQKSKMDELLDRL